MLKLNIPEFNLKIRSLKQSKQIFDVIRKKYVDLSPEEWVRQNMIHFLISNANYPADYFSVEKQLKVYNQNKRTDVVVYDKDLKPWMIVECKAPTIILDQNTLYQASRYNTGLNALYLVITNGMQSFIFEHKDEKLNQIKEFPEYKF